jgi:hypothetical protein
LILAFLSYWTEYLVKNLGMELPQAAKFSADLYRTYGSTLAGLVVRLILLYAVLQSLDFRSDSF